LAVYVVDIALIRIRPANWPGINDGEPIARVLEAWLTVDNSCLVDDERVLTSEMSAELIVGNPAMLVVGMLRLLRLLGRLGVFPIFRLALVSGRLSVVLLWRLNVILLWRFHFFLPRRRRFVVRRFGCFGAWFFLGTLFANFYVRAIEAMGLKTTQMIATIFDGITRHSPEGLNFKHRAEQVGWKEAVRNRDQGTWDWTENRSINPKR